jgi:hypothetical protein
MEAQEIRRRLEQAIKLDDCQVRVYLNLETEDDTLAITVFNTVDEAEAQKELLIESLVKVLS